MTEILDVLEENTNEILKWYKVSSKTGFLAEKPLLGIPRTFDDAERRKYYLKVDEFAYSLSRLISERHVCSAVEKLPLSKPEYFSDLTWQAAHRFMLAVAMPTQAYFRELLRYQNVDELMRDDSVKYLPPQLAVPLWELSKITGIDPSMAYGLYALWNWRRKYSELPVDLDNIELVHSFTDTIDEKWFVWIHQIVEIVFSPAIPALVKAAILAAMALANEIEDEGLVVKLMTKALDHATRASIATVDVLERMEERCNPGTYYNQIRMFYSFPRNVVFAGVEDPEIAGKPLEIYGETGGQTPYQHFRMSALGIKHTKSEYFMKMRRHMSRPFRELVELMDRARIREFVLTHKDFTPLARRYNLLVQSVIDWRVHHFALVNKYITTYGESHGTGKPPIKWLQELIDETKNYLID